MGVALWKRKCNRLDWSPWAGTTPPALKYSMVVAACMNFCPLTVSALSYLAIFSLCTVNSAQVNKREREHCTGMEQQQFFLQLIINMGTSGDARCALEPFPSDVQEVALQKIKYLIISSYLCL